MMTGSGFGSEIVRIDGASVLPRSVGEEPLGLQRLVEFGFAVPATWVVMPGATSQQVEALTERLVRESVGLLAVRRSRPDREEDGMGMPPRVGPSLGVYPRDLPKVLDRLPGSEPVASGLDSEDPPVLTRWSSVLVQVLVPAEATGVVYGGFGESRVSWTWVRPRSATWDHEKPISAWSCADPRCACV